MLTAETYLCLHYLQSTPAPLLLLSTYRPPHQITWLCKASRSSTSVVNSTECYSPWNLTNILFVLNTFVSIYYSCNTFRFPSENSNVYAPEARRTRVLWQDFDKNRRFLATQCFPCAWAIRESDISRSLADVGRCRAISATTPTSSVCTHNWEDCREELSTGMWCFPFGEDVVKWWGDFRRDRPGLLSVAISMLHPWWSLSSNCSRPLGKCWQSSLEIPEISIYCLQTSSRIFRASEEVH